MRPIRLRFQGITRYHDPVELDLSELPPGLVAVRGGNGEGKTTLLDMLGPAPLYRTMSSRPGGLKDWASRADAEIDLELAYMGHHYRLKIEIDPTARGGQGKEEAFLFVDGVPKTSKLVEEYDEMIEGPRGPDKVRRGGIFPPEAVFKAAAFAAQNRSGNFFGMTVPQRKALFARLLALDDLERLASRAADQRKILDAASGRHEAEAARLVADRAQAAELERQRADLESGAAQAAGVLAEAEARATAAAAQLAEDRARLEQLSAVRARALQERRHHEDVQQREHHAAMAAEARVAEREIIARGEARARAEAAEEAAAAQGLAVAAEALRSAEAALAARAEAANQAHEALQAARSDWSRARGRVQDAERATAGLAALEQRAAALDRARAEARELREAAARLRAELAPRQRGTTNQAAAMELAQREAAAALAAAEDRAALAERVPCGGRVILDATEARANRMPRPINCGDCVLLADATAAREQIPALRAALEAARRERALAEEAVAAVRERAEELARLEERERAAAARVDELHGADAALARAREQAAAGADAQAVADEAAARGRALGERAAAADEARAAALSALQATRAAGSAAEARAAASRGASGRLRAVEAALAELPLHREAAAAARASSRAATQLAAAVEVPPEPAEAQAAQREAEGLARAAQHDQARAREADGAARAALDRLGGRLAQLGDLEARQRHLDARRERAARRRAACVLLEQGLGRDGVQALKIDAAGPEVSELCSSLLEAVFGPRFTINLRTIQEGGKGRVQREVFDVSVLDALRGGARGHEGLSGGEQVLVHEALMLSLAVFNARRQGRVFETLWRDECDGALSEEMAALYPTMLRRALDLGGFRNVIFITHRPAVWLQADAEVLVEGGRAVLSIL